MDNNQETKEINIAEQIKNLTKFINNLPETVTTKEEYKHSKYICNEIETIKSKLQEDFKKIKTKVDKIKFIGIMQQRGTNIDSLMTALKTAGNRMSNDSFRAYLIQEAINFKEWIKITFKG